MPDHAAPDRPAPDRAVMPDATGPHLFTPFTLRGLTLPNRIMVSPMGQHTVTDGVVDDWHLMHLGNLAVSGVGCIVTGAVAVEPQGRVTRACPGLWGEAHVRGFARIVEFVARHSGARLGVQFTHGGRKGSVTNPWEGMTPVSPEQGGWPIEGACAIPYPGRAQPTQLSPERLVELRQRYVAATRNAEAAGFDLIEIHAAHGYLLHTFLSPLSNDRSDHYGGSLENRMRYPLEVFSATREVWPAHKPMGMRISVTDWAEGGWDLEQSLAFCAALKQRGCDYICASSGGNIAEQQIPLAPMYQVPFAEAIRREIGIPTIAVGLITEPEQAESIVAGDRADLVALGRAMLANPRWPWLAATRLGGHVFVPPNYSRVGPR